MLLVRCEPITDVLPMGGTIDRHRRLLVDGRPVATGIAPLADAWACTNPATGRGAPERLARHPAGTLSPPPSGNA
jgi:hypothetical protein